MVDSVGMDDDASHGERRLYVLPDMVEPTEMDNNDNLLPPRLQSASRPALIALWQSPFFTLDKLC